MRLTFLFAAAVLMPALAHALSQYETRVEGVDETGQAIVIKTDATAQASPQSAAPQASATIIELAPAPAQPGGPAPSANAVVIITEASAPATPVETLAPVVNVPAQLPTKGSAKGDVERDYGTPMVKHAKVGGSSRQQPPITRWDYPGFSVFFEYDHVVDAVQRNNPAPIHVHDGLAGGPK